jgi:peptidoglycan/xylan/chitin deacetylase (PgdA/CDA1 family)
MLGTVCLVTLLTGDLSSSDQALERCTPLPIEYVDHGLRDRREVALTFDDGPAPATAGIISTLHRYRATATFFVIGRRARKRPDLLRAITRARHEVGNHTLTHRVRRRDRVALRMELRATSAIVRSATGVAPRVFRAPHGITTPLVIATAQAAGMITVGWDIDSRDWTIAGRPPGKIVRRVAKLIKPGSIVLMHDGGRPRRHAAEALPRILRMLDKRGYRTVTVSQLLARACPARRGSQ